MVGRTVREEGNVAAGGAAVGAAAVQHAVVEYEDRARRHRPRGDGRLGRADGRGRVVGRLVEQLLARKGRPRPRAGGWSAGATSAAGSRSARRSTSRSAISTFSRCGGACSRPLCGESACQSCALQPGSARMTPAKERARDGSAARGREHACRDALDGVAHGRGHRVAGAAVRKVEAAGRPQADLVLEAMDRADVQPHALVSEHVRYGVRRAELRLVQLRECRLREQRRQHHEPVVQDGLHCQVGVHGACRVDFPWLIV